METTKEGKAFDAVRMMRETREKISSETQDMTFEQFKEYIKNKLAQSNNKLVGKQ